MTAQIEALDRDQRAPRRTLQTGAADELIADNERALRCRGCGAVISHPDALFAINHSSPVQVFPNPYGILYEILTLRHATGLSLHGTPTSEFTWFTGYAWQIASCSACRSHLGWRYTATGGATPAIFYGLLRAQLTEEPA